MRWLGSILIPSGRTCRAQARRVQHCIVRHFRSCLQHNRCGGNHPRLEGGEFSVGHVAEPFGDRVSRKMQIQGLRRPTITAVQQLHRGIQAAVVGLAVLGNGD